MQTPEAKKEDFRRYLEKSGAIDSLTSVLVRLYEESERPLESTDYITKKLGATTTGGGGGISDNNSKNKSSSGNTTPATQLVSSHQQNQENDRLRKENKELKNRMKDLESHIETLKANLKSARAENARMRKENNNSSQSFERIAYVGLHDQFSVHHMRDDGVYWARRYTKSGANHLKVLSND